MSGQEYLDGFTQPAASRRQPKVVLPHGAQTTGKIEWYTPEKYIESARHVMGTIDIDPASSELAQNVIRATHYYTIETDGLSQKWTGTVWLNPPYAAAIVTRFIDKLLASIIDGQVAQAILLTHNNIDTAWFHKCAEHATAWCYTRGRVRFYDCLGTWNSPTHGHVFMYFGKRWKRFAKEFRQYGGIVREYRE